MGVGEGGQATVGAAQGAAIVAVQVIVIAWGVAVGGDEPQLENTHETPQSSRDEGLLFLHGLESNLEASLQTPQEA